MLKMSTDTSAKQIPAQHLETISQSDGGLPAKLLKDELVVGVAPSHSLGPGNMLDVQLLRIKAHDKVHHLVHGHHLSAAEVQGLFEVALGDPKDALHTVIDECEGPGLLPIPPHLHLRLHDTVALMTDVVPFRPAGRTPVLF